MKFLEITKQVPKLFDWYFSLSQIKRIQLNHIVLLLAIVTAAYYNDKQHRDINQNLIVRINRSDDARAKEQSSYTKSLENYTQKFNDLLHKSFEKNNKSEVKEKP